MKINRGTLQVTSPAFNHGDPMPAKHTADGSGESPEISWTGAPEGTASFAVVVHDPDAPLVEGCVHWVLYGIPASVSTLPEGSDRGDFTNGSNGRGETGWT